MKIPLTEKQKEQLGLLGFNEEEMTPELLVNIKLYQEALSGNVSAIKSIKGILENTQNEEEEIVEDLTKEVKDEEKKIIKQLDGIPKGIIEINKELIHNVAFQSVQLRHLSSYIAINGVKEKYKNGNNQWGYKDRTEVKTYNNMMKSYQSCMKQLTDIVQNNQVFDDGFDDDEL